MEAKSTQLDVRNTLDLLKTISISRPAQTPDVQVFSNNSSNTSSPSTSPNLNNDRVELEHDEASSKASVRTTSAKKRNFFTHVIDHFKKVGIAGLKMDIRASLAFIIGCIFCVIPQITNLYGIVVFLCPIAVVLFDHSQSVGVLVQTAVFTSIGIAIGCSMIYFVLLAVNHGLAFLVLLFICLYVLTYIRAVFSKFVLAMLLAKVCLVVGSVIGFRLGANVPHVVLGLLLSTISGVGIAIVTSCLVFPVATHGKLKSELKSAFESMKFHLELSDRLFLIEADETDENVTALSAHQKAQDIFVKLTDLSSQLKFEVYFGYYTHAQYKMISKSSKKLIQYLALVTTAARTESIENRTKKTIHEVVTPLKESLMALTKASEENLDCIAEAIVTEKPHVLSKLQDLQPLFETFRKKQAEVTKHLPNSDADLWEELFHVYFYLFNIQKFIEELDQLGKHLTEIHQSRKIHFPGKFASGKQGVKDYGKIKLPKVEVENEHTIGYKIWKLLVQTTASKESKYAFKTAFAIAFLVMPMMIQGFAPIYAQWKGEWAVVSVAVISSMSFADTLMNGFYRVVGTAMGAFTATVFWLIAGKNPYIILPLTAVYAFGFFHIKQNTTVPKLANVNLLTFCVILFTKYLVYQTPLDVDIVELAYKRAIAVALGVIFMMIINRMLWPYLSRKQVRLEIATIIRDLAVLYSKIVSFFVKENISEDRMDFCTKLETAIQLAIIKSRTLLSVTDLEPRLKGAFPVPRYRELLDGCQRVLDQLISLRMMDRLEDQVREEIIYPLNSLRKEMVKQVLLLFYIVSGAVLSRYFILNWITDSTRSPLPMYLPNALEARDKLLAAIPDLPVVKEGRMENDKFLHYYVYAIFMKEIIVEIEKMARTVKKLFGTDKFVESMFASEKKVALPVLEEVTIAKFGKDSHDKEERPL